MLFLNDFFSFYYFFIFLIPLPLVSDFQASDDQCTCFNSIEQLKDRPTHLLVFLQHVILQFDPAPLVRTGSTDHGLTDIFSACKSSRAHTCGYLSCLNSDVI